MARISQSSSGRSSVNVTGPIDVESTGFDTLSVGPAQIPVGLTSIEILPANADRQYAHISNNSGQTIFIQYSAPAILGQGIIIRNNTLFTIDFNNLWLGSVNAIGVSPGQLIDVLEGE